MLSCNFPGRLLTRTSKAAAVVAGHLSSFRRCDGGGVIMLIGISIIPITLVLGLAVDSGLAYNARSKLQGAIDSAALAGAKRLNAEEAEMKSEARMFFDANYPKDFLGGRVTDFDADFDDDDREFSVDATVEVPTAFMRIAGIPTVTVTASAAVKQQLTSIELAMVLDVTGSMEDPDPSGGTKLEALQQASNTLLDVLFGDEDTAEGVAISVVPYSGAVNVGDDRTGWLTGYDPDDFGTHSWKGCVEARSGSNDRDDTPPSDRNFTALLWPPVYSYFNPSNDPNAFCPDPEVLPLTASRSVVTDHIGTLAPLGATLNSAGFVWGWRSISPRWRSAWNLGDRPLDYDEPGGSKAIVFMTDGQTTFYPGRSYYGAYGFTSDRRLGTRSPGRAVQEADRRLLESCTLAKAEGIQVFTIMYALNNASVEQLYRSCASSNDHFFDAPNGDTLEAAFRNIAGQLSSLRLSQ